MIAWFRIHFKILFFLLVLLFSYQCFASTTISKNSLAPTSAIKSLLKDPTKSLLVDLSHPMVKELRDEIAQNKHFFLTVKNDDFYVSSFVLSSVFRNILSKLNLIDEEKNNELKQICYIIDQLEKISYILAETIIKNMDQYYIEKYGVVVKDGFDRNRLGYFLFELLRNAYIHAHHFDYKKIISIGWSIENNYLKIYIGDERGGWLQNKLLYKLGVAKIIDGITGKKKRLGDVYFETLLNVAGSNLGLKLTEKNFDINIKKLRKGKNIELSYELATLPLDFLDKNGLFLHSS